MGVKPDHEPPATYPSGSPTAHIPPQGTAPWAVPGATGPYAAPPTGPPPKRRPWLPFLVIGVVVVAIAGAITISMLAGGMTSGRPTASSAGTATVPNVVGMRADQAWETINKAGFRNVSTSIKGDLSQRTVLTQGPSAGSVQPRDTAIVLGVSAAAGDASSTQVPVTTTVKPPPAPPRAITAREWALIARDPDAHIGESIIVYGQVTQFDAATGTTGFRANVDGVAHKVSYGYADYDTNTILTAATSAMLGDLVNKDLFRAEVIVTGSYSYDTSIGGRTTAPQLSVQKIEVTGQAK